MLTVALFSHSRFLCGAERMLLNLALLLERSGTVRPVLLVPGEGELSGEARRHGLACHFVPTPPWFLLPPGDMRDYCRGVTDCSAALKKILIDINSDIVLVNTMTNVPAMLAAVDLDIPSLLWVHGVIDSLLVPERTSEFTTPHEEFLLHSATRVIALSNYTSEFCSRVMHRKQLDVVHNWTPVEPGFTPPAEKYRSRNFVCLNTFDPHKGHATLLEAAALLKERQNLFELHLYGDGQVRGQMERQAASLGLKDHVRFQGRTTDVQTVYDAALAVVNPAQVEPFGMTLIEAMARKTPVVATRAGGPEDIVVDGESGFLVDRGDAEALANHMQAILESPPLARRLGEAGFQRVLSHFQEESASKVLLPLIEAAAGDFRGYEPAVKTLANIYQLWIAQSAPAAATAAPLFSQLSTVTAAKSMGKAARLAHSGIRRTRALGKRVLTFVAPALSGFQLARPAAASTLAGLKITNSLPGPIGAKASVGPVGSPQNFQSLRGKARYRFVPAQGNWAGIDVLVGGDPLQAAGRLRLKICSLSGQLVREVAAPLGGAGEQGWLGFRFPPIINAAGVPFDVEIRHEESVPGGTIQIYESDASHESNPATAARLRMPWQRKALYCTTWYL